VELELIKASLDAQIRAMVAELDAKEREVIRLRFGLDGDEEWTLEKIGRKMGLSRERVRQIESKAKEKLRRSHRAHQLRGALD
jgi:RNA polymerase sigma factor (sigma-70 family)